MKHRVLVTAAAFATVAVVVSACGGNNLSTANKKVTNTVAADASTENTAPQQTGDGGAVSGPIDCSVIGAPGGSQALFSIQLLAQLTTQNSVDLIKDGTMAFDPQELIAFLEDLQPLGGHDYKPFGDPADEIEFYLKAAKLAAAILAVEGPVPQKMFDELIAHNGDTQDFIMRQSSIAAALDEAC